MAVKMMTHLDTQRRELFAEEARMLRFLSRDAGVVQFYGAAFREGEILLVSELMEVRFSEPASLGNLPSGISAAPLCSIPFFSSARAPGSLTLPAAATCACCDYCPQPKPMTLN